MKTINVLRALCVVCLTAAMTACGASHYSFEKDIADLPIDKATCGAVADREAEKVASTGARVAEGVLSAAVGVGLMVATGGIGVFPGSPSAQKHADAHKKAFDMCMKEKGWRSCTASSGKRHSHVSGC